MLENPSSLAAYEAEWESSNAENALKLVLVNLSRQADVPSYRKIESIIAAQSAGTIKDFALVALHYAQLNLENELYDEPTGMISTGLGGQANKMRCYFVLMAKPTMSITDERAKAMEQHALLLKQTTNSELETIENFGDHVILKVLISFDIAVANWIDALTKTCPFVEKEYLCTNSEKPTADFIQKWMNDELDAYLESDDSLLGWHKADD